MDIHAIRPTSGSDASTAAAATPTLRRGAKGDAVRDLQDALARAGFDPGPARGSFNLQTLRAVRELQDARGLEVDGIVGPLTWAALARPVQTPATSTTPPTPGMAPHPSTVASVPGTGLPPPTPQPAPTAHAPAKVAEPKHGARAARIGGVSVYHVQGQQALTFKAGMAVDADGSPHAYHPGKGGLDNLANAGRPGNWWGIATDSHGKPVVQGPNDPAPGYYVSTTALEDHRLASSDPRRYVDSETVPFIAIPPQLRANGVKLGDLVEVTNQRNGKKVWAVVADIGPKGEIGEGSIKLARELGINPDARRGGTDSGIIYTVHPGSTQTMPLTHDGIQAAGRRLTGG